MQIANDVIREGSNLHISSRIHWWLCKVIVQHVQLLFYPDELLWLSFHVCLVQFIKRIIDNLAQFIVRRNAHLVDFLFTLASQTLQQ
jgi:hypothetical protein